VSFIDDMSTEFEIELSGVSRSFREGESEHVVLDNVDACFRRGEIIALRGRSGSGKSTLLNLVGGIDAPDSGKVVVAGVDLTSMTEHARTLFRRRHIGFIYQAFNLVPTLNVADNIRLVLELNGLSRSEADERIADLLGAVGLRDRADSYPDVLSGGEQQRVAIARALSHRPAVLLADEPTGNLDEKTAESVIALLDDLIRQSGGTLIMATHSTTIASTCDRTFELHDGKLVAA
jgi:putative ABC transport system ATP-binding protein